MDAHCKWGNQYDVVLGGGFISVRSPYKMPVGDVKYELLQTLYPFDNDVVLCSIKGSDLLSYFINSKKHTIIVDQIQSEQSSRFLKKRNRNI